MNEEKKDDFGVSSEMSRQANIFAHVPYIPSYFVGKKNLRLTPTILDVWSHGKKNNRQVRI